MQIIIVGCGKIGLALTEELVKEGHNITLIDTNRKVLNDACKSYDVMGLVGNGASYALQKEANIEETDLLIAVTGLDEVNLLCCLIAKKAGDCATIARVRNPIYNEELNIIKDELGLSMAINPEYAAATEIARVLRFPSAIKIDTFAKGRVEILKFKIPEGSILADCTVAEAMQKIHCDVLICAVERGEQIFIPDGNFYLQSKDLVSFVASPKNAAMFFKKIKLDTHQVRDALIVGGGKIGFYLAKQLLEMKIPTKIIEKDYDRCLSLSDELPAATIINGDATNQDLLMEEGITSVDSLVSLTDLDEENIVLSLFAKKCSKAKIVTKVNRISFDSVISDFDLETIIHPKYIAAEYITQYVRAKQNSIGSNVETLCHIIEGKVEALEFYIREDSPIVGIPIEKLSLKSNLLIACINHEGKIITPRGKDIIHSKDTVIVVTTIQGLNDIKDILEEN